MKSEKIFEALRNVDEELLERSEKTVKKRGSQTVEQRYRPENNRRRRRVWVSVSAAAACLGLMCASMFWAGVWPWQGSEGRSAQLAEIGESLEAEEDERPGSTQSRITAGVQSAPAMDENTTPEVTAENDFHTQSGTGADQEALAFKNKDEMQSTMASEELAVDKASKQLGTVENETVFASMKELLADSEYGSYVPQTVPGRYTLESAVKHTVNGKNLLSVVWSSGMDTIELFADRQPGTGVETVDVSRPETYDVNLYEIPYSDSVPQEYLQSISNPVFRREDLSLETVRARLKTVADGGDTPTPRASFGVLYGDGTLVTVHARGSAEEIYGLFEN